MCVHISYCFRNLKGVCASYFGCMHHHTFFLKKKLGVYMRSCLFLTKVDMGAYAQGIPRAE